MNISSIETTTQHEYTTERDACIIEMLDELGGMVRNFSYKYNLEFDDCYQHAALIMLECWDKIPDDVASVERYLNGAVRRNLFQLLKRTVAQRDSALSLDRENREDGSTFADTLEADMGCSEGELQHMEKVIEAVHAALRECRLEEQEYACTAYGLTDYTPVPPASHPMLNHRRNYDKPRRADHIRLSIKNMLKKHPQVQGLVQRETAVL